MQSFRSWRFNVVVSCTLIMMLAAVMVIILPARSVRAAGTTYYVDSVNGNDSNDGQSPQTAWQNLTMLNGQTFGPGDQIDLAANSVWNGQQLAPQGSGSAGSPIVVDRYGSGNTPQINGQGNFRGTVYLHNQQYWEINNLEVTNQASSDGLRAGFYALVDNGTTLNHIYVQNLLVHNVQGEHQFTTEDDKDTGGIIFASGTNSSTFNDILVANCVVHDVVRSGIHVHAPGAIGGGVYATNVVFRNNTAYNVSGDAIWTYGTQAALLDHNTVHNTSSDGGTVAMWDWSSNGDVFQYNEVYDTLVNNDGEAFDCDGGGNQNDIWQYNYSHDNPNGFATFYSGTGCIFRYNISQNDGRTLFNNSFRASGAQIYNNTFYLPTGSTTNIVDGDLASDTVVSNNIFYNLGSGGYNNTAQGTWTHNLFYGNHPSDEPADPNKITSDPLLTSPGSGGSGLSSLNGYKLQANSPAIGSGVLVTNNGGQDFFGNGVSATCAPNRGADNGQDPNTNCGGGGTTNYVVNPGFENGDANWSEWIAPNSQSRDVHGIVPASITTPHSGSYSLGLYTNSTGFIQSTYQDVSVPNGTYTLSVWIITSGGMNSITLGAHKFDSADTYAATGVPTGTSYTWTQYSVSNIQVSNGMCEVFINGNAPGGGTQWIGVDDFSLVKNG